MARPHAMSTPIGNALKNLRLRLIGAGAADASRSALGREGEQIAERYLKRQGFRIVARNFRARGAEIDLVAMDHDTLVFVEVKRLLDGAGAPEDAVNRHKRQQIRRAAEAFIGRYRAGQYPARFDVVAIRGTERPHLEHLKDAF
jgi:putative endonuclease